MTPAQKLRMLEKITRHSLDMICLVDRQGCFAYVSDACREILGYTPAEMVGRRFIEFILPEAAAAAIQMAQDIRAGGRLENFSNTYRHKSGRLVHLLWSGAWSEEDGAIVCVARNVTGETLARQQLREQEALHRILGGLGADIGSLLDEKGSIIHSFGDSLATFGYVPEALAGRQVLSFLHPDDQKKARIAFYRLLTRLGTVRLDKIRFRAANGGWRWIEATLSNQLHNPGVRALVSSSRDITARVEGIQRLEEGEQRFRSLFENHTDAAVYESREGIILDANPALLALLGKVKAEVVQRPLADFLPPGAVQVCEQKRREAFLGGPVHFELVLPAGDGGEISFDAVKVPVNVGAETIGVYGILRDVTESRRARQLIERQAQKLDTILESIRDAFFVLDREWRFSYVNAVFAHHEGYSRQELLGACIWEIFPRLVAYNFYNQCLQALADGQDRHFEESYAYSGKTYSFSMYPSEEGLSVFFNDITELHRSREELKMLSLVADRTTNGVVIFNRERRMEWVNEGFTKLTGYSREEALGKLPIELLRHEKSSSEVLASVQELMDQGKPATFEVLNRSKSGEDLWLAIEINPVKGAGEEVERFVAIQTDITALKQSELALSQLSGELYRHNHDLQQFTFIVSHNLRAPVANILVLARMLTRAGKNEPLFSTCLQNLQDSAVQLDTVLRDVNTILSVRESKHALAKEQIGLEAACRQACLSLQEPLQDCGGKVHLDLEKGLTVSANKAYFHSILYNLLSNAIKYRSDDRVLQAQIVARSSPDGGIRMTFSDNGSGFDRDKVFKLYHRFHPGKAGRGIGLYLMKTHVEAMEGSIEVLSQVNEGTTFTICLP